MPSYVDETAEEKQVYVETMKEGEKLNLTYKLIDTEMPDNGYIKWYSDMPTLVDVDQNGVVKAFDSSKGAVIQNWIDNEVKPIPLVGKVMATVLEKALFNDKIDIDSMDTEAIIDIVEAAFGSDSPIAVGLIHTRANLSILFANILITLTRLSMLRFMTRTAPSLITIHFVSMLLRTTSGMPLFFRTELISPINRRFLPQ